MGDVRVMGMVLPPRNDICYLDASRAETGRGQPPW